MKKIMLFIMLLISISSQLFSSGENEAIVLGLGALAVGVVYGVNYFTTKFSTGKPSQQPPSVYKSAWRSETFDHTSSEPSSPSSSINYHTSPVLSRVPSSSSVAGLLSSQSSTEVVTQAASLVSTEVNQHVGHHDASTRTYFQTNILGKLAEGRTSLVSRAVAPTTKLVASTSVHAELSTVSEQDRRSPFGVEKSIAFGGASIPKSESSQSVLSVVSTDSWDLCDCEEKKRS